MATIQSVNTKDCQVLVDGQWLDLKNPEDVQKARDAGLDAATLDALMPGWKLEGNRFVADDKHDPKSDPEPPSIPSLPTGLLTESHDGRYVGTLTPGQRTELQGMGEAFAAGPSPGLQQRWSNFVHELCAKGGAPMDVNELVQAVLKEAYLSNTEDLRFFYEKVKYFNACKKAIREHCNKMRALSAQMKTDATHATPPIVTDLGELQKLGTQKIDDKNIKDYPDGKIGESVKDYHIRRWNELLARNEAYDMPPPEARKAPNGFWYSPSPAGPNGERPADATDVAAGQPIPEPVYNSIRTLGPDHPYVLGIFGGDRAKAAAFIASSEAYGRSQAEIDMGIPRGVPGPGIDSPEKLDDKIKFWEERLSAVGDDAQLANVELQNCLQKQQQTLQMLSNISKMLHDTAMAVIRKIGG